MLVDVWPALGNRPLGVPVQAITEEGQGLRSGLICSDTHRRQTRHLRRRCKRVVKTLSEKLLAANQQGSAHSKSRFHHQIGDFGIQGDVLRTTPIPQLKTSDVIQGLTSRKTETYASK